MGDLEFGNLPIIGRSVLRTLWEEINKRKERKYIIFSRQSNCDIGLPIKKITPKVQGTADNIARRQSGMFVLFFQDIRLDVRA